MKRWLLTMQGYDYKPKIYAETADKAMQIFRHETILSVEPYEDIAHLNFIERVKNQSELLAVQNTKDGNQLEWYRLQNADGILTFRIYKDIKDEKYFDIAEYQFMSNNAYVYPIMFTYSTPQQIEEKFFTENLSCEVYSIRFYGQPKLAKPKELKGIKQSFSVDYIPKHCSCSCFIKDNDLWIKHRDFFSTCHRPSDPKDYGTPLSYRLKKYFNYDKKDKFIYPDSWGVIILRNEAWIVIRNIRQSINRDSHLPHKSVMQTFIKSECLVKYNIRNLSEEWERFFESVCLKYKEKIMCEEGK